MRRNLTTVSLITASVIVLATLAWANRKENTLPGTTKVDFILVEKHARKMTLFANGQALKKYNISLGRNPIGDKIMEGDKKTPEGVFTIEAHKPDSAFHYALRISYPDQRHKDAANLLGVSPGSDIMIHGIRNGLGWIGILHQQVDWTAGCIALTNWEIDEISKVVEVGTTIEIKP